MFTGIIEDVGRVGALEIGSGGARLEVRTKLATDRDTPRLGDSIAVMGVCLTVVRLDRDRLSFDVSTETLARSNLQELSVGSGVHLERALRVGGRLDGHIVQGHVDGVARLTARERAGDGFVTRYELPAALLPQVVEKGSIALDGVSLTVAALEGPRVSVAVVPHTAKHTVLTETPIGRSINVETDILGKYVQRLMSLGGAGDGQRRGIDLAFLAEHGLLR